MRISDWSADVCSSDLAADVDEMAGAGEQRHRLALPEGRGDDRQVVQMAGALPRIVGDEGVALAHRRDGKAVDEVLYRQRHGVDVAGRPGDRLRQHAAFSVEDARSEEHTSELQSLMRISYAVFCLKKKISNLKMR